MIEKHHHLLQKIINRYLDPQNHKVFIFGSRATETNSKFSDYDIGIEGSPLDPQIYFSIIKDLEESDLPYTVDVVEFCKVSSEFKKIAKQKIIKLN